MDEAGRLMLVQYACPQQDLGALRHHTRKQGDLLAMDTAHSSSMQQGIGGMRLIMGLVAGGIIGWLASAMVHTHAWRVQKRRVIPIQVQTHLKGVDYPVGKSGLLERATAAGADAQVLETSTRLPEKCYTSPIEVSRALGKQA
jgi:Protein of unknown function (DUF2795)